MVRMAYWVIKGSGVRMVSSCWMAWQINMRSKGSLGRAGSNEVKKALPKLTVKGLNDIFGKRIKKFLGNRDLDLG